MENTQAQNAPQTTDSTACEACGGPASIFRGEKLCRDCGTGEVPQTLAGLAACLEKHGEAPLFVGSRLVFVGEVAL